MSASLHVLVLAAGASTRLGRPKQLVSIGGRPALHRVVAAATSLAGHAVTVVLGAHAKEIAPLLAHSPASVVVHRGWKEGIGSSLRFGASVLPPGCEAALVLLGDQVAVSGDDLKRLASAWREAPSMIVASVYGDAVGVPALFPSSYFPEFAELRGDAGARRILQRNASRLVRVSLPSAAIDLDTPEDLAALS